MSMLILNDLLAQEKVITICSIIAVSLGHGFVGGFTRPQEGVLLLVLGVRRAVGREWVGMVTPISGLFAHPHLLLALLDVLQRSLISFWSHGLCRAGS